MKGGRKVTRASPAEWDTNWPTKKTQPTTALHTESSPSQQNPQTPITHTDPNDPLPTPQLTNDNSLTGWQDRQRAPLKHSRRYLENHTRTDDSFTIESLDEEVEYGGSFDIDAIPPTGSDQHGVHMRMIDKTTQQA